MSKPIPSVLARVLPGHLDHAFRRGARWARALAHDIASPRAEWPELCPGAALAAELCAEELVADQMLRSALREAFARGAAMTWRALRGGEMDVRKAA